MQSSSNSLLHFTNSLDVILAILKTKFYGSYCREQFSYNESNYVLYVPKISFCDIPEETISCYVHYGKYCIGLSKEWGKIKRLNPVLYIEKHSIIAECLINAFHGTSEGINLVNDSVYGLQSHFRDNRSDKKLSNDEKNEIYNQVENGLDSIERVSNVFIFGQFMPYYVKHYEDTLIRKEEKIENYRFYDEREWCYVPAELQTSNDLYKSEQQYQHWRKNNQDKPLLETVSLDFAFEDVTHLIVETEKDKEQLIQEIDNLLNAEIDGNERNRLKSVITIFGTPSN